MAVAGVHSLQDVALGLHFGTRGQRAQPHRLGSRHDGREGGVRHVVAIGRITLTDAPGRRTTSDYADVWRLRDGKLAELRAFVVGAEGG